MSITTYTSLMSAPSSKKTFLCEITAKQEINDWEVYIEGGFIDDLDDFIDNYDEIIDALSEEVYKREVGNVHITNVSENGTDLIEVNSIEVLIAGTWFYGNGYLYVAPTADTIYQDTIIATIKYYFSDRNDIIFNDRYYEPFLKDIPILSMSQQNLFYGLSIISSGKVSFYNNDKYFDDRYNEVSWLNNDIVILSGGEDLPYSEYQYYMSGKITDKEFKTGEMMLSFQDDKIDLDTKIPENTYVKSDFPNLEDEDVGKVRPYVFGTVKKIPVVNTIRAVGTATSIWTFKIAETSTFGGIKAINQVYVKDVPVTHHSANLTDASFKLSSTIYEVGDEVSVDCQGYQSGTVLIENPVAVVKKIMNDVIGTTFNSDNFDTATVNEAQADADEYKIGLFVGDRTRAVNTITSIMRSCLGDFSTDNTGKYYIKIWNTNVDENLTEIDFVEIIKDTFKAKSKREELSKTIAIGYSRSWNKQSSYAWAEITDDDVETRHGITKRTSVSTLLSDNTGAELYAERMSLLTRNPTNIISLSTKLQLAQKNIGDRIRVSFKRQDDDDNIVWVDSRVVEIVSIKKDIKGARIDIVATDLRGIGSSVGKWTSDTPTFPLSLGSDDASPYNKDWNQSQKNYAFETFGYWTDDDGLIDDEDSQTLNKSKWW